MPAYGNRELVLIKNFIDIVQTVHDIAQRPPQSITYQSNSYTKGQKKSRSVSNNSNFLMFK